jgi:hypothetical protein
MKGDNTIARGREAGAVKQRKLEEEKNDFDLFFLLLQVRINHICVAMAAFNS